MVVEKDKWGGEVFLKSRLCWYKYPHENMSYLSHPSTSPSTPTLSLSTPLCVVVLANIVFSSAFQLIKSACCLKTSALQRFLCIQHSVTNSNISEVGVTSFFPYLFILFY